MAKRSVIETLVVELTTDNSQFNRGMRDLQRTLDRTGKSISRAGRRFSQFMVASFTAITVASLKLAREYDYAMNRVQAVTRATEEEMLSLNATAMLLGRTTARSAREIAQGMETLGLAGFNTQEIEDSITAVTSLSVISQQDMALSAQNAANIMSQFGIAAQDLERSVDALAATATSSNQTVGDLVSGLRFAGPIARQAGLSLEETAAVMGILANNGIRAGIAGRALRMGILKLVAPTSQAEERLRQLNISVTDSNGELLGFNDMLTNVNAGIRGLADAERLATLRVIFGTRALGPMNLLLQEQARLTEGGSNAFQDYANSIMNSNGRAEEMMETLLQGLPGAMILFRSATEGLLLKLQELYSADAERFIRNLTELFNRFSDLELGRSVILDLITDWERLSAVFTRVYELVTEQLDAMMLKYFNIEDASGRFVDFIQGKFEDLKSYLSEEFGFVFGEDMTRGAVVDIALLVAAIGPALMLVGTFLTTLSTIIGVIMTVVKQLGILGRAFASIGGLSSIVGIFAFVAAVNELIELNPETFVEGMQNVILWFKDLQKGTSVVLEMISSFKEFSEAASVYFKSAINVLVGFYERFIITKDIVLGLVDQLKASFNAFVAFLEEKYGIVIDLSDGMTKGLLLDIGVLTTAILTLSGPLGALVGWLAPAIATFTVFAGKVLYVAGAKVLGLLGTALGTVGGSLLAFLGPLGLVIAAVTAISVGFSLAGDGISGFKERFATEIETIKNLASSIWETLKSIFGSLSEIISGAFTFITTGEIAAAFSEMGDAIIAILLEIGRSAMMLINIVLNLFDAFLKTFLTFWQGKAGTIVKDVLLFILNIVTKTLTGVGNLFSAFNDVVEIVFGFAHSFINVFEQRLPDAVKAFIDVFKLAFNGVKSVVSPIIDWINDMIYETLVTRPQMLIDTVKTVFTTIFKGVVSVAKSIPDLLYEIFVAPIKRMGVMWNNFAELLYGVLLAIIDNYKTAYALIGDVVGNISDFFTDLSDGAIEALEGLASEFTTVIDGILSPITNLFSTVFTEISGFITDIRDELSDLFSGESSIATFANNILNTFLGVVNTIKDTLSQTFNGIINALIDAVNTYIIANINKISIEIGGKTFGFNIPQIPNVGEQAQPTTDPTEDPTYTPGGPNLNFAATGAYVKKQRGGKPFVVGEGKDDEVISPIPMLQQLLRDAITNTQRNMTTVLKSSAVREAATQSLGTNLTPLHSRQVNNGGRREVTINNHNTFAISGDIQGEVREALRKEEINSKLRLQGVKT